MILHILGDDKNIVKRVKVMFDCFSDYKSDYVVEDCGTFEISHLDGDLGIKRVSFKSIKDFKNLDKYKSIIIHNLSDNICKIISENILRFSQIKLIWVIWGADMYSRISIYGYNLFNYIPGLFNKDRKDFFGKETYFFLPVSARNVLRRIKNRRALKLFRNILYRFDYILGCEEDFKILKIYFPNIRTQNLEFCYYPIEETINISFFKNRELGTSILLGNSSSNTNNHIPVLRLLSKIKTRKTVIVPLSYGNSEYRDYIVRNGNFLLGPKFKPLLSFLNIDSYYEVLSNCDIMILPHLRQQAIGNIIAGFYLGIKVFLYGDNPLYREFINKGFIIYKIESIVDDDSLNSLDNESKQINHDLSIRFYSDDAIKRMYLGIIKKLDV